MNDNYKYFLTVSVLGAGFVIVYMAAATFLNYHEESRPGRTRPEQLPGLL